MSTKRVLLVDDDSVTLFAVARGLERLGYEVTRCSDSQQAVRLAVKGAWALIILDLGLPSPQPARLTDFDGLTLLRWLRLSQKTMPVIMFTGSEDFNLEEKARAAGAFAVVRKGDPPAHLIETVRRALEPVPNSLVPAVRLSSFRRWAVASLFR